MEAPSEDVKDMLLDDATLGLTFKTDLFIGKEPDLPQSVVTIFDTPARQPQTTLGGADQIVYHYPSVQIRVRDAGYITAFNKATAIISSLHGKHHGDTYNGSVYIEVKSAGEPAFIGWTEKGLAVFVANINLQRKEA